MMKINTITNCTGCSACYSICPKSAITMTENNEGFLYPQINDEKCIECHLCEQVCPALSPLKSQNSELKSFAAVNNNETIRLDSSSGGVFTAIAEKVLMMGGKVFGAKFSDDFSIIHSWTDNVEDLKEFRGSKYVQSAINESLKECEKFLKEGATVLFTGTPCQIQGLRKFLRKDYDNLLTVDIICHGVPSVLMWKKYIDFHEKRAGSKVVKTGFRRKDCGWRQFSLWFSFANHTEYSEPQTKGKWMLTFNKNIMMRKSCYDCPAKGCNIVSDITIGDFWGIKNYLTDDDNKGTSIVFVNTPKGAEYLKEIADKLTLTEIKNYDALKHNTQLLKSLPHHPKREKFIELCKQTNFDTAYKKYVQDSLYFRVYKKLRHTAKIVLVKIGILKK